MLTKQVFALLSLGGKLSAERCFPSPFHYRVVAGRSDAIELNESDVCELIAAKLVDAPHIRDVADSFEYRITRLEDIRAQALADFKFGFGRCAECGTAPIGVTAQGVAARHGHTKHDPTPCAGSGKALSVEDWNVACATMDRLIPEPERGAVDTSGAQSCLLESHA